MCVTHLNCDLDILLLCFGRSLSSPLIGVYVGACTDPLPNPDPDPDPDSETEADTDVGADDKVALALALAPILALTPDALPTV